MFRLHGRKFLIIFMVCTSIALAIPPTLQAVENAKPRHGTDGWKVSSPEEQGLDPELLKKAAEELKKTDVVCFAVIRNENVVFERYYRGQIPRDYSFSYSIANFLLSALIGSKIHKGDIKSIDQPVLDYFPEAACSVADPRVKNITIKHLLTMTSGFGPLPEELFRSRDWIGSQLSLLLQDTPGKSFIDSPRSTYLLSAILTRVTGQKASELARLTLFKPLCCANVIWHTGPEEYNIGGEYSYMRPLDMAKLGSVFLNHGTWNGRQILPPEWVDQTIKSHSVPDEGQKKILGDDCIGYGYQVSIRNIAGHVVLTAEGNEMPPNLCMIPDMNVVIVIASYPGMFKSSYSYQTLKSILVKYILPASNS